MATDRAPRTSALRSSLPAPWAAVFLAVLAAAPAPPAPAAAQVSVAPTTKVMDGGERFTRYFVTNNTGTAQEVTVGLRFGYPRGQSDGSVSMAYGEDLPLAHRSARSWLGVFPEQFRLEPGERQTIRIQATPPGDLEDGTYWARVVTSAVTEAAIAETLEGQDGEDVVARMDFRLEHVTSVLYHHGAVETGVAVGEVETRVREDEVGLRVPLELQGNSPYLGRVHARVIDSHGNVVREEARNLALYEDMVREISVSGGLEPGEYTAELEFETERSEIPARQLVRAPAEVVGVDFDVDG